MNYMDCLGEIYPTVFVSNIGDPSNYSDVTWVGGDSLPTQEELDIQLLNINKTLKIAELSKACQIDIIGGFTSDALGTTHRYDSEEVDQLNLIGAYSATEPSESIYYATRPIVDEVVQPKEYKLHTNGNLRQILGDGAVFKLTRLQKFNAKRDYVNLLGSISAVLLVTWESTP